MKGQRRDKKQVKKAAFLKPILRRRSHAVNDEREEHRQRVFDCTRCVRL